MRWNDGHWTESVVSQGRIAFKGSILGTTLAMISFGNAPTALAQTTSDTTQVAVQNDALDLSLAALLEIKLSPFDVATRYDDGYLALNSVSGSRFDSPIRDLPFAIQAFTKSFIQDQNPRDIFDVARYSPGVTYRSNDFNEGNANLAIRGFAVSGIQGSIQMLRDGFHGPSIFDMTNISRVEVVKGPASFLYGQVAPGGIVNIITKSPDSKFAANGDLRYGSYNEYHGETDVTGTAVKNLYYRLASSYDHDMNYWKPYDALSWNASPSLLWQPTGYLSLSVKYEHFSKNESPQVMQKPGLNRQSGLVPTASDPNFSGVDVPGLPDDWNSMSDVDFRNSETNGINAWIDYKLGNHWDLRTAYSYQFYEVDMLFSGNLGLANNTTRLQGRRLREQTYSNEGNTYEAVATGKYQFSHASLRLLLGTQYIDRNFDAKAGQIPNDTSLGSIPTASPLPLWDLSDPSTWNRTVSIPHSEFTDSRYKYDIAYTDKSIYGGGTVGLFENRLLSLIGFRLTSTENSRTDHLTNAVIPISASVVTPQYGLLFKITPSLSAYATYAESFVPGSQRLANLDGTFSPASPTKGTGYDIGLKSGMLDNSISGTFTLFDVRNENIINDLAYTDSMGLVTIYSIQSGEQRSRGVEMDATITPTNHWQLYLSYSYMDARIVELSGNDKAILAQDTSTLTASERTNYKNVNLFHNAPLQMSAPHLANLWTRYNISSSWLKGVYFGGGANFIYDQALLPDGPKSSHQTYTLVNAMLGYAWDWRQVHLSMDVHGKNLLDEHYRPSQSSRGRPREIFATLKARY